MYSLVYVLPCITDMCWLGTFSYDSCFSYALLYPAVIIDYISLICNRVNQWNHNQFFWNLSLSSLFQFYYGIVSFFSGTSPPLFFFVFMAENVNPFDTGFGTPAPGNFNPSLSIKLDDQNYLLWSSKSKLWLYHTSFTDTLWIHRFLLNSQPKQIVP